LNNPNNLLSRCVKKKQKGKLNQIKLNKRFKKNKDKYEYVAAKKIIFLINLKNIILN
jgi:hypothetical protein